MVAIKPSRALLCALVLIAVVGASAGRALQGGIVIKQGMRPFSKTTVVVCKDNRPGVWDNGKWVDVFWWNNDFWPIWAINDWDLKLLDNDARSCSRITKVTGPLGNSVINVNNNNGHHNGH
ncbi:hypothetical protein Rsub_06018 [Raphidocelis subcapitata]|uniref:Uncharacterized protein n=1 Tax=Raphidocelis subcapitata TaxID=307507 RepID=A0A2V0P087_9CHLO|nr:hypothetical protein Rsub_06018 [Raphidocelis subcapitata]|eukprot:GBF93286.1 hypothetical protein Rsub_06018 [Raphidocelis subcapitata]